MFAICYMLFISPEEILELLTAELIRRKFVGYDNKRAKFVYIAD